MPCDTLARACGCMAAELRIKVLICAAKPEGIRPTSAIWAHLRIHAGTSGIGVGILGARAMITYVPASMSPSRLECVLNSDAIMATEPKVIHSSNTPLNDLVQAFRNRMVQPPARTTRNPKITLPKDLPREIPSTSNGAINISNTLDNSDIASVAAASKAKSVLNRAIPKSKPIQPATYTTTSNRSEEHTSEPQSRF